ncbi:hypothetical protein SANTM175S_00676 [Streptomyces antimycoticus]
MSRRWCARRAQRPGPGVGAHRRPPNSKNGGWAAGRPEHAAGRPARRWHQAPTIYRRWGDLAELLSDVAVERLRPDTAPKDHGGLASNLAAWANELFLDEMASPAGRAYIRDALLGDPDGTNAGQCSAYAANQVGLILGPRDRTRGRRPRGRDDHRPRRRPPDVPHSLPARRTRRRLRPRTRGGAPRPGRRGRVTTRDTVVPVQPATRGVTGAIPAGPTRPCPRAGAVRGRAHRSRPSG